MMDEDDHKLCESCRFWDLYWGEREKDNADFMHPCTVSGSFRCDSTLFTEADFGCVHWSKR
jgi:hypothetical protein